MLASCIFFFLWCLTETPLEMPPPLPSSHRGMTANPSRPARYRPGKPIVEERSSDEDEGEEEEEEEQNEQQKPRQPLRPMPKATSFPSTATATPGRAITRGVRDVKIEEQQGEYDDGFVTEEEEEEEEKEESTEEESSSEEEEAPRRILPRPTFVKKDQRNAKAPTGKLATDTAAEAETHKAQRREKADSLIRDHLEKEAIARSSRNRAWDADEPDEAGEEGAIDDTDGIDPEAEYTAWKLRELKRVKREREAIETAEREREEIERRRNLTVEEREREDSAFIAKQREEKDVTHGQTGFMQRYFHKGAFYREGLEASGLDKRNIMGRRFVDEVDRETLPEYMQVRDMTKIGKKGRTRYRDLRSEDTGQFGKGFDDWHRRRYAPPPLGVTDDRFLPDRPEPRGPTGANASAMGNGRGRKRSPSPYDREKRRRVDAVS